MKLNKTAILKALKADYSSAERYHNDIMLEVYAARDEFDQKPYGNEVKGKSAVVSGDIKRQHNWLIPSIIDPFVSQPDIIKANPITYEDGKGARQAEILLNTQFCRQFARYNFVSKLAKVLDRDGTAIIQTGWEYEEEKSEAAQKVIATDPITGQEYIAGEQIVETIKILKNKPTAKVCRIEDIYIDPTCQDDIDNCQFIIYRYESDLSTLKNDGRYKNLEKLHSTSLDNTDVDYEPEDDTVFKYEDNPRKKLVVYEYWGNYDVDEDGIAEPIVCAWVNDTIIRLQGNPYPDKKIPFVIVPNNAVPFKMHGEPTRNLISDQQKIKTGILRGIMDNMAQSNNGQVGVPKGALDAHNMKKFLSGSIFEFNPGFGQFWSGGYNQIPGSAYDTLGLMNKEIESATGTMGFSGGISNSGLSKSATGARGVLDATAVRRNNIVRNISENAIKPIMRKWLSYDAEFLSEQEIVRYTNEEFVTINRDDLSGLIDIEIHVATAEENEAKAQELAFMMQTGQQGMDPEESKMIRAEIARLQKMPELAKEIETFQPQPDPIQQELRQLELENAKLTNAKLKADIGKVHSDSQESQGDAQEKAAQARYKDAQTQKVLADAKLVKAKADLADMEFIQADEGYSHKEALEKEAQKAKLKLEADIAKLRQQYEMDVQKKELDFMASANLVQMQKDLGGPNEQLGIKG
jgi:hypothetical protein